MFLVAVCVSVCVFSGRLKQSSFFGNLFGPVMKVVAVRAVELLTGWAAGWLAAACQPGFLAGQDAGNPL